MKRKVCRVGLAALAALATVGLAVLAGCGDDDDDAPPKNLIVNGSFETPDIPPGVAAGMVGGWVTFYVPISGWTPANDNGFDLMDNVIAAAGEVWQANDGDQFAELDAYANGGVFQTVQTVPGREYVLRFAYSPRPGVGADSNIVHVYFDNTLVGSVNGSGIGMTGSTWSVYNFPFTAEGASTTIKFLAGGSGDGRGGFLDNVQMY
jgi:hypothetical protein